MKEIYSKIIQTLPLKTTHRESLKSHRGFPDAVVDELMFRSSGPEHIDKLNGISKDLKDYLSNENIIIPYFNKQKEIYYIRQHKFSMAGTSTEVYVPYHFFKDKVDAVVLAESEFKAIASCIMGVPAIGIPGIHSCVKNSLPKLVKVLEELGVEKVVICFDNEIKNNPKFKNYKKDFTVRYDTQFRAFIMSQLLKKANFMVSIATLKDEWRKEGKADIDGVLAAGINYEDYKDCIKQSQKPYTFKKSWDFPAAHLSYLERKIDYFFYNDTIKEDFNCYFVKDGKKDYNRISNFIIKITHSMLNSEGVVERYCQLISNYGNSKIFIMKPEHMVSKMNFNKLCYEIGDYEFYGKEEDLRKIWHYLFIKQTGKFVNRIDCFGYHDELDTWFFNNIAYTKDNFHLIDENNIFWIDDTGYKMPENYKDFEPPIINIDQDVKININDIRDNMSKTLGEDMAKLILGWTIGILFMPEIIEEFEVFPFLFFYGKTGAGKSTIVNWISHFFGFGQTKGFPMNGSSVAGIRNVCSKLSMMPVWLEEYRLDDDKISGKNAFLRSVYDRSSILKATLKADEIKVYKARSTIILSGEQYPNDSALNSRCILVSLFKENRDKASYLWMENNKSLFSCITNEILKKRKEYWNNIKEKIYKYKHEFESSEENISNRLTMHYSILGGISEVILGDDQNFRYFLGDISITDEKKRQKEQALNVFLSDVYDLYGTSKIKFMPGKILDNDMFAFYFNGCYSEWEQHFKGIRKDIPASKNVLKEEMQKSKWFLKQKTIRIENKPLRCFIIDKNSKELPEGIKLLISSMNSETNSLLNSMSDLEIDDFLDDFLGELNE